MVSKYSRSAVVSAGVSLTKSEGESVGANQVGEFDLQKPCQMVQWLRICLAMQETLVQSLGRGDPLEEMATHSSILAWKIPWAEKSDGLQSMESQRVGHD